MEIFISTTVTAVRGASFRGVSFFGMTQEVVDYVET